jgi:hypothetical protein
MSLKIYQKGIFNFPLISSGVLASNFLARINSFVHTCLGQLEEEIRSFIRSLVSSRGLRSEEFAQ